VIWTTASIALHILLLASECLGLRNWYLGDNGSFFSHSDTQISKRSWLGVTDDRLTRPLDEQIGYNHYHLTLLSGLTKSSLMCGKVPYPRIVQTAQSFTARVCKTFSSHRHSRIENTATSWRYVTQHARAEGCSTTPATCWLTTRQSAREVNITVYLTLTKS